MKTFILGYPIGTIDFIEENLVEYTSFKDADYNTEDWCTVKATTMTEAKKKYDQSFLNLKKGGKIEGCM